MHRPQNYKNTIDLNLRKALKNKPHLHLDRVKQKLYATLSTDYINSTQPNFDQPEFTTQCVTKQDEPLTHCHYNKRGDFAKQNDRTPYFFTEPLE